MKSILLSAVLTLIGFSVAQADPGSAFNGVKKKLGKCYSREYTNAHMVAHPKQTVEKMAAKFSITTYKVDGEEYTLPILKIQAKAKNDSKVYAVEMPCYKDGNKTRCAIDCDGPNVKAYFSSNNPGSMLIDNKDGYLALDSTTCGDEVTEEQIEAVSLFLNNVKGGDDIFLLHPMKDYQCL